MTDIRRRTLLLTGSVLPLGAAGAVLARDEGQVARDAAAIMDSGNDIAYCGTTLGATGATLDTLTYDQPGIVAGRAVRVGDTNGLFRVAPLAATDFDIQGEGGVRYVAIPDAEGKISTAQMGHKAGQDLYPFLQKAVDRAFKLSCRAVIPSGHYTTSRGILVPDSSTGIVSIDMTGAVIDWTGDASGDRNFFQQNGARPDTFILTGGHIRGTHAANKSPSRSEDPFSSPVKIYGWRRVIIRDVEISYSRFMGMQLGGNRYVDVRNCHVHHCARDGINCAASDSVYIAGNRVEYCGDDAIAVHTQPRGWSQRNVVIANNKVKMAQGIKVLGGQNVVISGNVLEYVIGAGINFNTEGGTSGEGRSAVQSLAITGNTILNVVNRSGLDAAYEGCDYLVMTGGGAQAGTLDHIPGERGTDPYPYWRNGFALDHSTSVPVPYPSGITISGNSFITDLPTTGMFSDLGEGLFYLAEGEVDLDLSARENTRGTLLRHLGGKINELSFTGNTVRGVRDCIRFSTSAIERVSNWLISDNLFYSFDNLIWYTTWPSDHPDLDITWSNNLFDADPYHLSANRLSNGGWASLSAAPRLFPFSLTDMPKGMEFKGNKVKNVAGIVANNWNFMVEQGLIFAEGNTLYSSISQNGFSPENKGVGQVTVMGFTPVYMDCDPTSAGYGGDVQVPVSHAYAQPTTGAYVLGWFVKDAAVTLVSDKYRLGWVRKTTGTSHAAGTDWSQVLVTTD